jgi:hypothetical protein
MSTNPRAKVHHLNPNSGFKSTKECAEFLAATENKDLEFKVLYWEIASVGSTARDILALGGVQWKNAHPTDKDWDDGKVETAFSCLPMLTINGPSGQVWAFRKGHRHATRYYLSDINRPH